jgi:hypothetical protein
MAHRVLAILLLFVVLPCSAATTNNDDSCDIAVLPAATLLLPYFEVDLENRSGETTVFTIANVTNLDRIARVTLWTDRAYPVIAFNVYLTGYDTQSINLYDVLARGVIAPDRGTGTAIASSKRQKYADANPAIDLSKCGFLAGTIADDIVERMQIAFTEGNVGTCTSAGGVHDNATGYATIDVVGSCTETLPSEDAYWTSDIRYDNALTGDYEQIVSADNAAQGGPLIHIRAVPEGGTPLLRASAEHGEYDAGFARTFYARYQPKDAPKLDGRQPLPSRFAARWIEGGASDFQTGLKVWREGNRATLCGRFVTNSALDVGEIVVFDEAENAAGMSEPAMLPAASVTSVADSAIYPQLVSGATSGWLYLDLDDHHYQEAARQGWVVSSMRAEGRYSTDSDAVALGNGCSPSIPQSEITTAGGLQIGPARNNNHLAGVAATDNDDSCDIGLYPAATLLLPYFEVDCYNVTGETTLFSVTNVSNRDQIARVTLWTDYGYPVISFNLYLTGYDVQSINLYDVLARGLIAPNTGTGTSVSPRGPWSDPNNALDLGACGRLPGQLPDAYIDRMQAAFEVGVINSYDPSVACNNIGNEHDNAVGYATIDLVRNCSSNLPTSPEYWTKDLAYDNVLIGDHQQVHSANNFAQGSPLVHIRAIPEGGTNAERMERQGLFDARFGRTFYSRFQPSTAPKLDGRQPLPSRFVGRWVSGGRDSFQTDFKIWREGKRGADGTCATWDDNVTKLMEIVMFDEAENAVGDVPISRVCTPIQTVYTLPATSRTSVRDDDVYPQLTNGAIAGWVYLNLDNCEFDSWGSNNWVMTTMRAEGRYSVEFDATGLGNGCSAPEGPSEVTTGVYVINPSPNPR